MGKEAVSMESKRRGGDDDFSFLCFRIAAQMNGNATGFNERNGGKRERQSSGRQVQLGEDDPEIHARGSVQ